MVEESARVSSDNGEQLYQATATNLRQLIRRHQQLHQTPNHEARVALCGRPWQHFVLRFCQEESAAPGSRHVYVFVPSQWVITVTVKRSGM